MSQARTHAGIDRVRRSRMGSGEQGSCGAWSAPAEAHGSETWRSGVTMTPPASQDKNSVVTPVKIAGSITPKDHTNRSLKRLSW